MRKIVAGFFISADGVVESPQNWHFPYQNEQMDQAVAGQMQAADTMLLGRNTYEEFAGAFANAKPDDAFAAQMTNMPKYVVSSTLKEAPWANTTIIGSDVEQRVAEIKEAPGSGISMSGSAVLVRSLLRAGLIDELKLLQHPLVVGKGAQLFDDFASAGRLKLKLAESQVFDTGVLYLTYVPA